MFLGAGCFLFLCHVLLKRSLIAAPLLGGNRWAKMSIRQGMSDLQLAIHHDNREKTWPRQSQTFTLKKKMKKKTLLFGGGKGPLGAFADDVFYLSAIAGDIGTEALLCLGVTV